MGVAVVGVADGALKPPLLSVGEAKWNEVMGLPHLTRLRRIRDLITAGGRYETAATRLACYSGAGFTPDLRSAADRGEVVLVDLPTLYGAPPS